MAMAKKKLRARCGPAYGMAVEPEFRHREASPQEQMVLASSLSNIGFSLVELDLTSAPIKQPEMAPTLSKTAHRKPRPAEKVADSGLANKFAGRDATDGFGVDPGRVFVGYGKETPRSALSGRGEGFRFAPSPQDQRFRRKMTG